MGPGLAAESVPGFLGYLVTVAFDLGCLEGVMSVGVSQPLVPSAAFC